MARLIVLGLLLGAGVAGLAAPASAHPTDEIVQQLYVTPERPGLAVELDITPGVLVGAAYVQQLDSDGDGTIGPAEGNALAEAVRADLSIQIDTATVELRQVGVRVPEAELLAAGVGTIQLFWAADLPAGSRGLRIHDSYDPGAVPKVQMSMLVGADAVPVGAIQHTDGGRTISAALNEAATAAGDSSSGTSTDDRDGRGGPGGATMIEGLRRPLTSPWALVSLLGACVLLGALHALTPGHGKALLASYLVGESGTGRHAVGLGVAITFTHTAAVLTLGVAVLAAGNHFVPGAVVPALTVAAGLSVLALGARLVRRRWQSSLAPVTATHDHSHGQDHHPGHAHTHSHGRGDGNGAAGRAGGPRGVLAMGFSAGLIPCPEALSVMLLAAGLHRAALGIVMIIAFSVGLAGVLVGIGLALVRSAPLLARVTDRVPARLGRAVPLLSALVVSALGAVMAVTGATQLAVAI
ncbi:hypothetical protein ACG83_02245 [Frankia sp. R43]|nr:hypothetical protein ACG83_02245 [Frankia sp. R43]